LEQFDFGFCLASQGGSYGLSPTLKDAGFYDRYVLLRAAEIMKIIKISVKNNARVQGSAFFSFSRKFATFAKIRVQKKSRFGFEVSGLRFRLQASSCECLVGRKLAARSSWL